MGLLDEIVSGIQAWLTTVLRDWAVVLIAAVVFAGGLLAGRAVFGEAVGLGLGIASGLLVAFVLGQRLRKRHIEEQYEQQEQ